MKLILLMILLIFSSFTTNSYKEGCLEMDIIILVDISGSIEGYEYHTQKAISTFINGVELADDGVMIAVSTFSSEGAIICSLTSDKHLLKTQTMDILSDNGSTNVLSGFYVCLKEFVDNGRENTRKMIILISDGAVDNSVSSRETARQLYATGIGICSVLIISGTPDRDFMQFISTGGCYIESSYENLVKEIEKLDICI